MFGWLKKSAHPHTREDDAVWMSDEARLIGVFRTAGERRGAGEPVVLGTYSSSIARALLDAKGDADIDVLEAHQLKPSRLQERARGAKNLSLLLVGADADPGSEEKLLTQCKDLPFRIRLQVHHSMDDLIRAGVATDRLQGMLEQLGMGANEAISHKWASRALEAARRKGRQ